MRPAEGKVLGTIIVPLFIRDGQTSDDALADSAFRPIWEVVRALRAHDDLFADQLDELRTELGRQTDMGALPPKLVVDLPEHISESFASAFSVQLVEQTTSSWDFSYGLLQRYAARETTCATVDAETRERGYHLGRWVQRQRTDYRQGRSWLTPRRIARLQAVPGWTWDSKYDASWERYFELLRLFVEREGHAAVPTTYTSEGLRLGWWAAKQRRSYHGTYAGKLDAERRSKLEQLPGWSWHAGDAKWEKGYAALVAFVNREGHVRIPNEHVETGVRLGAWTNVQRGHKRRGKLSEERAGRLEALPGWFWQKNRTALWEGHFEALRHFVEREGHSSISQAHREAGLPLGRWTATQRARYLGLSGRPLLPDQIERLESLAGWDWRPAVDWDLLDGSEVTLGALPAQVDGHTSMAATNERECLEQVSGDDHPRPTRHTERDDARRAWEQYFRLLLLYVEREGNASVRVKHREQDMGLGQWVVKQRQRYLGGKAAERYGSLTPDQVERLEALPGWSWRPLDEGWVRMFALLERFAARENHIDIPSLHTEGGVFLNNWVNIQRQAYRKGALSSYRIERLESMPEWTWDTIGAI